ncbi:MAG: tetratricopeptide repeat protein [Candidatus Sericytochromatia bacterium]|nr:tetratricopeptide repeat protein [Candidatus Sericytochromatia bacterium]
MVATHSWLESAFAAERRRRAKDYLNLGRRLQTDALGLEDEDTRRNLLRGSIAQYRRSLEFHPAAETHALLAWCHGLLGNLKAAIASGEEALRLDPTSGHAQADLGVYYSEDGRLVEAEEALRLALSLPGQPKPHVVHYNLGRVLLRLGALPLAIQAFEEALDLAPGFSYAASGLAHARTMRELQRLGHAVTDPPPAPFLPPGF